ncbi:MAG: type II toxin-antitoxin system VapC family toxin [Burkholderiales bacterium]|nr:type II toxin-antitoxin system VapC family toxin [Phycisphaerae bacterium]
MSEYLIDANVLLDIATADAVWLPWSLEQFNTASSRGAIFINPIIYAELAPAFLSANELDHWLDPGVFRRAALPYSAGWLAAQAFIKYRRGGGSRNAPLPDFYICAHAEIDKLTLITRDATRYRTYFPGVALISP